ncbi:MAG: hypothetical protein LLF98_02480 [Clostridium sp.]|uniref:hypothetical protein n=1 Tax=Clostridium sp. TaxID=1506 RepID=UPI0025C2721D|nr:hypothetical protein [Clostridium sp.]MCE5220149.1 hypothetical protein [Clostridium sp.]
MIEIECYDIRKSERFIRKFKNPYKARNFLSRVYHSKNIFTETVKADNKKEFNIATCNGII